MHPLQEKIQKTIRHYSMIREGEHVLAAVSGGPDSIAMLHLLHRLQESFQFQLTAAHLNHGTRGASSDDDAQFVQQTCETLVCPLVMETRDVPGEAQRSKTSFQETARKVRLQFLEAARRKVNAHRVALAHTGDDQAETVLMNLLRGSGPRGLGGMRPVRGNLMRPLFESTREEVLSFLSYENLAYRDDASNRDMKYLRNRIRLELLPHLKEQFNPSIQVSLRDMAEIFQWEDEYLNRKAERWFKRLGGAQPGDHHILLERKGLSELHPALQARLVRRALEQGKGHLRRVTFQHILNVLGLVRQSKTGKIISLPDDWAAELEADFLKIYKISEDKSDILKMDAPLLEDGLPLEIPGITCLDSVGLRLQATVEAASSADIQNVEPGQALLDYDLTGTSLKVRFWQAGDRFQPLGMSGTKKLKDYFNDEKFTRAQRRNTLVLTTEEGDIIWIVAGRISERFKVSPDTRNVLNFKVLN